MVHRTFQFLTISLACLLLLTCRETRHRNVLVITIDTTRADHIGCYGFHLARTPNIDQLASEGLRASNAVSSAPITMPSHTSIFTGLYPPAHGVRDNGAYALGEEAVTLAERLRDQGYTTHAFVSALVLNRRYNLNQGFESYDDDLWSEADPKLFMIRSRRAPKTADHFLAWLDTWNKTKAKPFFTWIHFFDPHQPYHPEPGDMGLAPSAYDAEITSVDRAIGRIVQQLREDGQLDNTLLVVIADHGESLGEHGEQTHAIFVYDATVRVPLIIRAPWLLKPGVYGAPVRSVDLTPTILDALGMPAPERIDGQSLLAAMEGKQPGPELPQYSESLLSEVGFGMAPLYAVRDGGYKYIRAPRPELYDLRKDPHELHNLVAELPRVAARLNGELTKIMEESGRHAVKAAASPMTKETEESLQALGYLAPHGERNAMQGIDPKDGLPLHNKLEEARHLAQQGKWDASEKVLLELIAITPRNVSALNVLGLIGVKTGDMEKARKYYGESLAIDPTQFRVHGVLGGLALATGKLDEATREFKVSLQENPHFAESLANLGFIESLQGHEPAAEEWYRKGIAADPTFPRVYRRLGDLYYERGDFTHAYDYYKKTIQIVPTDVRAILQAGNSARRLGKAAEAEALFKRGEKLRPDGWIPTYNRICLLATTGHADDALKTLSELSTRHPMPVTLVEHDPDLASIRALPGYAALRKQLSNGQEEDDNMEEDAG
jgi:arylsulfatase A-like enzyme/tetratricopeptide (TPR) repeat protein